MSLLISTQGAERATERARTTQAQLNAIDTGIAEVSDNPPPTRRPAVESAYAKN